jgi:hypothetical protein
MGCPLGLKQSLESNTKRRAAMQGRKPPASTIEAVRKAAVGRRKSPEEIQKIRLFQLGKPKSKEAVEKQRQKMLAVWAKKLGGKLRRYQEDPYHNGSPEYKFWRIAVFARDAFRCQACGTVGKKIQAHHIKSWANFPHLRYEVSNGTTLCAKPCHLEANRQQRLQERKVA